MSPLPSRVKSPSRRCSWSWSEPFSECFLWTSCIGRILCWPWEFLPHIRPGGGTLESAFQQGLLLSLCIWELGNSFFFFLLHLKFLRTLTSQNPHLLSLLRCTCFSSSPVEVFSFPLISTTDVQYVIAGFTVCYRYGRLVCHRYEWKMSLEF